MVTQKLNHKHVLFCYFIKVVQNVKGDFQIPYPALTCIYLHNPV